MTLIRDTSSTPRIRGIRAAEDFSLTLTPRSVVVTPGTTSPATVADQSVLQTTSASTDQTQNVGITAPLVSPFGSLDATLTNLTPGVVSLDAATGVTIYIADGTATVEAATTLGRRRVSFAALFAPGQTVDIFQSFAAGSLAKHLSDSIAALISGVTSPIVANVGPVAWSAIINLFNAAGHARNTTYAGATDLTCVPETSGAGAAGGILVTPRDMIHAAHYPPSGTVTFVDGSGTEYARTVTATRSLTSPTSAGTDLLVTTLSADLPSAIAPAKVLPANWRTRLPNVNAANGYPCVFTNQDRTLLLGDLVADQSGGLLVDYPTNTARQPFWYRVRGGDSGSPVMMIVNGHVIALGGWNSIGVISNVADNLTQINAAIAANGSPYTVTTVDLSAFNAY